MGLTSILFAGFESCEWSIMAAKEVNTQTDNEVHDVFYYKTRAYKAEVGIHVEQVSMASG